MIARDFPLTVESFCLAIGPHSIGLPAARSVDMLLTAYLRLIDAVRTERTQEIRRADVAVLVDATGVDGPGIQNRLRRLRAAV